MKRRKKMSKLVKKFPALCLFVLAALLGLAPSLPAAAGLIPPAFMQLGALSASLAGIILAAIEGRKGGVKELLRRALIWRVGLGWWVFVLLFPALLAVVTLYSAPLFGAPSVDWSAVPPIYNLLPMLLMLILFAGLGEEFGWRGFALPRLQKRYSALVSGLFVGLLWWLWHLPLFFIEGVGQYRMAQEFGFLPAFLGYGVLVISAAVTHTWLFNNTRGSVLLVAVYHGSMNAWMAYTGAGEHPSGIFVSFALSVLVSIAVVLLFGAQNLSRKHDRNVLVLEGG
jgi:membrane protease YdiL (CAAX protease family)